MPRPAAHPEANAAAPAGAILAGGANRRFGSPKGLARVGGVRIVDRVAAALRAVTADLLLVANASDAGAWLPGVPVIADAVPGAGGLSGVHAALTHMRRPALVVAWDMPFVSAPLLRALAQRCAEEHADACFAESPSPVGLEPFCACFAPSCLPALEAALASGRTGGAEFARALPRASWLRADEVATFGDPARLFLSVNTAADLARAEALCQDAV
ncbi:MAG TPA: molybdenum cofactor guanylyltransferase [Gemmatimonadaceae bacterium]